MTPLDKTTLGVLKPIEQKALWRVRARNPHARNALIQLGKILGSRTFSRVQQSTRRFLTFVVAYKLLSREDQVKETTIAMAVFGEAADFNPLETSKVRVAGWALRQRVEKYYRQEGLHDATRISIPEGTYVPDIRDEHVAILIENLVNWAPNRERHLGGALTDEVTRLLRAVPRIKVAQTEPRRQLSGAAYRLRGSVETSESTLRLNVSLLDTSSDSIAFWHTFEICRRDAFRLPMQVATAIAETVAGQRGQTFAHPDELNRRFPIQAWKTPAPDLAAPVEPTKS